MFLRGSGVPDSLDTYLDKVAGGDRQLAGWLGLAVNAKANGEELNDAFNEAVRGSMLYDSRRLRDRVVVLSEWLKAERARDARWLSNVDGQGRPKRLLVRGFEAHYNAAKKWYLRDWRRLAPGKLVVKASDPSAWGRFTTKTRDDFYRDLTRNLPPGTDVHLNLADNGCLSDLTLRKTNLVTCKDDFYFNRSEDEDKTVYHGGAAVARRFQQKGIARAVNRNLFELYKEMGVRRVDISVGQIGVYAWARAGFVPSRKSWPTLREHLNDRLDFIAAHPGPEGGLPTAYLETLKTALREDNPKVYWFVVDQRYRCHGVALGKLMTLNWHSLDVTGLAVPAEKAGREKLCREAGWGGQFDLADPDCVARMETYCNPSAKSAEPMIRKEQAHGRTFQLTR